MNARGLSTAALLFWLGRGNRHKEFHNTRPEIRSICVSIRVA